MKAAQRRRTILDRLTGATSPIPAAQLGNDLGVSRQIIVGDVALLRAGGEPIRATNRGYLLTRPVTVPRRSLHVRHDAGRIREELSALVNVGARILDASIEHPAYGQITVDLMIASAEDIDRLTGLLDASSALSSLTAGEHWHTIEAVDEATLDRAERVLAELGILVKD